LLAAVALRTGKIIRNYNTLPLASANRQKSRFN